MILLLGIPTESPLRMVRAALDELGGDYRLFNQRRAASCGFDFAVDEKGIEGTFNLDGEAIPLARVGAAYCRLMDDRQLPELEAEAEGSPARVHSRGLHEAIVRWLEIAPGRMVNRSDPQGSNGSKPYQAQLIRDAGFCIPETLITNDPEAVRAFHALHRGLIYKSISGVRSIVARLDIADNERLERIRWCPVQFQEIVAGTDVRVHVVGGEIFATEILSEAIDYRYAAREGHSATLAPIDLPDEIKARCIALTAQLGLEFSGIDLRRTRDDEYYCFEVNPSPGFSYFEANTGQPIANAVARHLMGA